MKLSELYSFIIFRKNKTENSISFLASIASQTKLYNYKLNVTCMCYNHASRPIIVAYHLRRIFLTKTLATKRSKSLSKKCWSIESESSLRAAAEPLSVPHYLPLESDVRFLRASTSFIQAASGEHAVLPEAPAVLPEAPAPL